MNSQPHTDTNNRRSVEKPQLSDTSSNINYERRGSDSSTGDVNRSLLETTEDQHIIEIEPNVSYNINFDFVSQLLLFIIIQIVLDKK